MFVEVSEMIFSSKEHGLWKPRSINRNLWQLSWLMWDEKINESVDCGVTLRSAHAASSDFFSCVFAGIITRWAHERSDQSEAFRLVTAEFCSQIPVINNSADIKCRLCKILSLSLAHFFYFSKFIKIMISHVTVAVPCVSPEELHN